MSKLSEKISDRWRRLSKKAKRRIRVAGYGSASLLALLLVGIFYQSPTALDNLDTVIDNRKTATNAYLDQVKEANLAVEVANSARLSVENNVAERSISIATKAELAQADETVITKPILTIDDTNNAITKYVTVEGDNASSVAEKFGISSQTIKWANGLVSDLIEVGATITVPAVDGVVYTVQDGDTIDSIVAKYGGSAEAILSQNNLTNGIRAGETIVIPDGILPNNERPNYQAPATRSYSYSYSSSYSLNIGTSKAGNNYSYGYCTWYAYNRRVELGRPAYRSLGNANTWDNRARSAGITVSNIPIAGAIFQTDAGYYGHVGIVESVNPDGTINISDMNGIAGWNRVGFKENVSPYGYQYIY